MGRQGKSFKNYRSDTKFQKKHIKGKKLIQEKRRREEVKSQKILSTDYSSDEDEKQPLAQQGYLKKKEVKFDKNTPLTPEEVAKFLSSVQDDDEELEPTEEALDLMDDSEDESEIYIEDDHQEGQKRTNKKGSKKQQVEEEDVDDQDEDDDNLDEEGDIIEDAPESDQEDSKGNNKIEVTKAMIASWIDRIQKENHIPSTKKLLLAFYKAVRMYDSKMSPQEQKIYDRMPYTIKSHSVYLRIIMATTKFVTQAFNHALGIKPSKLKLPDETHKQWKKILPGLKTFFKSLVHLLTSLKDSETVNYILNYAYEAIHFAAPLSRESRQLLKVMLDFLGHEKEDIRFRSLLCIHRMASMYQQPFLDLCLKGVYFTFVKNSAVYNQNNFEIVDFLMNCVVEIYGIDFVVSYQHAFVYIRQLAITLKRGLQNEKNAWALVMNWKFINSLKCWTRVICAYPRDELVELAYPLCQIIQGTCQVNSNPRFYPARFRCVDMLNQISKATDLFVPVGGLLMACLEPNEAYALPRTTNPQCDFLFKLKSKEKERNCKEFQVYLLKEVMFYSLEFLALHATNIAFPEISYPIYRFVRHFIKEHTVRGDLGRQFVDLLKKIDENNKFIFSKRSTVTFTPMDLEKVKAFLPKETVTPIGQFYASIKDKRQADLLQTLTNTMSTIEADEDQILDNQEEEERQAPVEKVKNLKPVKSTKVEAKTEKKVDKKRKATDSNGKSKKIKKDLKDNVQDIDLDNF